MPALTLAVVQADTHWHAPECNRALFDRCLEDVPADARMVVLPEMFATGFTMASAEMAEAMDGATVAWMRSRAAAGNRVVCGSLVIAADAARYNRFVWARPDGTVATYDKRHLFRMAGEHEHYAAGRRAVTVELDGVRVRPLVCYDLRFPVWSRRPAETADDYDVLLVVANWPAARQLAWSALLRARAVENQCFVVGVNRVGVDGNGVEHAGGSAVYDPWGQALLELAGDAGVACVTLDTAAMAGYRAAFPAWRDADPFHLE